MELGVTAVILFGIPREKDPIGLENFAENGIIQQAIRAIKKAVPEMVVVTDVCLCEYTDHGHCGILNTRANIWSVASSPSGRLCPERPNPGGAGEGRGLACGMRRGYRRTKRHDGRNGGRHPRRAG